MSRHIDDSNTQEEAESSSQQAQVEMLLSRLGAGDQTAFDALVPLVYGELRRLARRQVGRFASSPTLDTTALVNEVYLKLAASKTPQWNDRCHFLAVAATAMRQILLDYSRRRSTERRGSDRPHLTLDHRQIAIDDQADSLVAIDEALERLEALSPRLAKVVICTFFGGMTHEETAIVLAVTDRTVRRDWQKARAFLHRELAIE